MKFIVYLVQIHRWPHGWEAPSGRSEAVAVVVSIKWWTLHLKKMNFIFKMMALVCTIIDDQNWYHQTSSTIV